MLINIFCNSLSISSKKVKPMVSDIDDNFLDGESENGIEETNTNNPPKGKSLVEKQLQEQAQKNLLARKRIDDLKEKKYLKDLLDDSKDW